MDEQTEWNRIVARINGLQSAMEAVHERDNFGMARTYVLPSAVELKAEIEGFVKAHEVRLSAPAIRALNTGLRHLKRLLPNDTPPDQIGIQMAVIGALRALESEVSYHIQSFDDQAAKIVERALLHLQRSLVVDPDLCARWSTAFNSIGEVACEKLGAIHLLLHGIYAFKTNSVGERTDLILGERLALDERLQRGVSALILTEWKRATRQDEVAEKFQEARRQATRYAEGSLAGFEIHRFRYLILVTREPAVIPPDITDGDIEYRLRNVAVDPLTPSKVSRRKRA